MIFEVQIIGSNSAISAYGRNPTSQLVKIHNEHLLIDCGEGTQNRMLDFGIKRFKINHIFISHLHGDHYFGLIGLLTTYHLLGRTSPLHIYGPKGLKEIIELQLEAGGKVQLNYPIEFHLTEDSSQHLLLETASFTVSSIPLKHRIPTTGFVIRELPKKRKIIKEKLVGKDFDATAFKRLLEGFDVQDKAGNEYSNKTLTADAEPPKSYAYCSDTIYDEELVEYIKEVDLLYHETTFIDSLQQRATKTFHSTTIQAATIAKMAKVRKLIVGHFSSKYKDLKPLLSEVKSVFPMANLALEGHIFEV